MAEIITALETLQPEWGKKKKKHFCEIMLVDAENSVQNSTKHQCIF